VERSLEERALLNPAFIALVAWNAASGYESEGGQGLPFPLAFLAVPIALHPATRARLPRTVRTSLAAWLEENPFLRETFPKRAQSLSRAVREGVGTALAAGLLSVADGGELEPVTRPRRRREQAVTEEIAATYAAARFVGRWFARAGTPATTFALWGVRP
jgi:hypothetical protein